MVGRLDVEIAVVTRPARSAQLRGVGSCRHVRVVVSGTVRGSAGVRPVVRAVQDDVLVAGIFELQVVRRGGRAERVPENFRAEALTAALAVVAAAGSWPHAERSLTAGERRRVDLRLEMALQHVPVAGAHHDGPEGRR